MDSAKEATKTGKSKKTKAKTQPKKKTSIGNNTSKKKDGKEGFSLYLRNLPHSITEEDLRDYFRNYGDVKGVEIDNNGSQRYLYKFGFIYFKDATSAETLSRRKVHYICKRKVIARPSDSWKQKNSKQEHRGRVTKRTAVNDPKKSPFLRLNDDCLLYLCSFLTFGDKVNLSQTCVRFSGVLDTILSSKDVLTVSKEPVAFIHFKKVLVKFGQQLHQIKVYDCRYLQHPHQVLELIPEKCPNLRELRMPRLFVPSSAFEGIGSKLHHLTKLELPKCYIDDKVCKSLALLKNVEYLDLSFNESLTGVHLDKFPKLLFLNLRNCSNFEPKHFTSICEKGILKKLNIISCHKLPSDYYSPKALLKLKNLEELLISSIYSQVGNKHPCGKINNITRLGKLKMLSIVRREDQGFLGVDFFKQLAEQKSKKLESLTLIANNLDSKKIEYIYKMQNLKKLYISFDDCISDPVVEKLGELKQLEYLSLPYCKRINPKALIKLLKRPTGIKELDIAGHSRITNGVIFEIAKNIKSKKTKSPCIIHVGDTKVSADILKDKKYLEYSQFVKLSFGDFLMRTDIQFLEQSDASDEESDSSESNEN